LFKNNAFARSNVLTDLKLTAYHRITAVWQEQVTAYLLWL